MGGGRFGGEKKPSGGLVGLLGMNDELGHRRLRSALPFLLRFRKSLSNFVAQLHMSAESCMSISTTSPPFVLRFKGLGTTMWYFMSSNFLALSPKALTASLSFDLALNLVESTG